MSFVPLNNRGFLFKNKNKKSTMSGHANVEGVNYYINAFTEEGKDGNKYLALSLVKKEKKPVAELDPFEEDVIQ